MYVFRAFASPLKLQRLGQTLRSVAISHLHTTKKNVGKTIFVKGLPYEAIEEEIYQFFKTCGEIKLVKILAKLDGTSSGCGYVTFQDILGRKQALLLDGAYWPSSDRTLGIEDTTANTLNMNGVKPKDCDTVIVANVPFDANEDDIREVFSRAGIISEVRLARDEQLRFKGFCHIVFKDSSSVDQAISLAGTMLKGRQVRIDYAPDRYKSPLRKGGKGGKGGQSPNRRTTTTTRRLA